MKTLTADKLDRWKGRIIDVRNVNEFAGERLPRAECVPLGQLMKVASKWDPSEPLLVMCKSGMRSRDAMEQLRDAGFTQLTMLEGGIQACKKAGANVIVTRRTLPIIRQVMITAGLLLLLGLFLASRVDGRFIFMDWLVACGLVFAGVTGYCPMAKLLERMPWNRVPESSCTSVACEQG